MFILINLLSLNLMVRVCVSACPHTHTYANVRHVHHRLWPALICRTLPSMTLMSSSYSCVIFSLSLLALFLRLSGWCWLVRDYTAPHSACCRRLVSVGRHAVTLSQGLGKSAALSRCWTRSRCESFICRCRRQLSPRFRPDSYKLWRQRAVDTELQKGQTAPESNVECTVQSSRECVSV